MRNVRNNIILFQLLIAFTSHAQSPEVVKDYIDTYKDLAISEMQRTGVPASIKLAQGIYETTAGTSKLVLKSNNHFGIKCKSNWTGESVSHDDDAQGECFRKYPSAGDSYRNHSDFLKNNSRYASLFTLDPTDYKGWANGLKKAGYATNPKYPQALIKMIEEYNLQDYTLKVLGKKPVQEDVVANTVAGQDIQIVPVIAPVEIAKPGEKQMVVEKSVYPEGEFKINETKVIYAKKGTSFLATAKQYGVDLSRIFEFNEIPKTEEVNKDQLIYLQRKRKTGNNEFHVVQPGETLHDIAQQQAIRLESLVAYNWLKEGEIPATGERLSLKRKAATMPRLAVKTNYSIIPKAKMQLAN